MGTGAGLARRGHSVWGVNQRRQSQHSIYKTERAGIPATRSPELPGVPGATPKHGSYPLPLTLTPTSYSILLHPHGLQEAMRFSSVMAIPYAVRYAYVHFADNLKTERADHSHTSSPVSCNSRELLHPHSLQEATHPDGG